MASRLAAGAASPVTPLASAGILAVLTLTFFAPACGGKESPQGSGETGSDAESGDTLTQEAGPGSASSSDDETESGDPPPLPEPLWVLEFEGGDAGRVVDLDLAFNGDALVVQYDEGEEGGIDAWIHKVSEDGDLLWSTKVDEVPRRLCAMDGGDSYFVGSLLSEGGENGLPSLVKLGSGGEVMWSTLVTPEFDPLSNTLGIECKRADESVLVVGTLAGGTGFLAHYDTDGVLLAALPDVFVGSANQPATTIASIALQGSGNLLIGTQLGTNPVSAGVTGLDAAAIPIGGATLTSDLAMGPWVATRGGAQAAAALEGDGANFVLRVASLAADSLEANWESVALPGIPNVSARPLVIGEDGRVHAAIPNGAGVITLASYPSSGAEPTLTQLSDAASYATPSALGLGRSGEILVGGQVADVGWLAAYEL